MTIINANRLLEDNGFISNLPNNYNKRIIAQNHELDIRVSNSLRKFSVVIHTRGVVPDRLLDFVDKFTSFEQLNKVIRFIRDYYGIDIAEIKTKGGANV